MGERSFGQCKVLKKQCTTTQFRDALKNDRSRYSSTAQTCHPADTILRTLFYRVRRLVNISNSVWMWTIGTALLLFLSQAPFDLWPLASVAFVPWLWSLKRISSGWKSYVFGLLTGLFFWMMALNWLSWLSLQTFFLASLFQASMWGLCAWTLQRALTRGWSMVLVFPILWTALEFLRDADLLFGGFPWYYLGHALYKVPLLIQVADVAGDLGLSFFLGCINGALFDLLLFLRTHSKSNNKQVAPEKPLHPIPCVSSKRVFVSMLTAFCLIVANLWYGCMHLEPNPDEVSLGPRIGVVDPAVWFDWFERSVNPEETLSRMCQLSRSHFSENQCDLLLFPESMLPFGLNYEFRTADVTSMNDPEFQALAARLGLDIEYDGVKNPKDMVATMLQNMIHDPAAQFSFNVDNHFNCVQMLAQELGCSILAGCSTLHPNPTAQDPRDLWVVRTSVLQFDSLKNKVDGPVPIHSKMKLTPIFEAVPFKKEWPWLYRFLLERTPEHLTQVDPGTIPVQYPIAHDHTITRVATAICFEGTFARLVRKMIYDKGERKADLLAYLTNEGWFYWSGGKTRTTEHAFHRSLCVFRAIENRTPIVRAANTGLSCLIDSSGRIQTEVPMSLRSLDPSVMLLTDKPSNPTASDCTIGQRVVLDHRISFFAVHGFLLAQINAILACFLLLALSPRFSKLWRSVKMVNPKQ